MAGCLGSAPLDQGSDPASVTDDPSDGDGQLEIGPAGLATFQQGATEDDRWFAVEGTLVEGQGVWLDLPFNEPLDGFGASYSLAVDCGQVLVLPPAVLELEEDNGQPHFVFEPGFLLAGPGMIGGGLGMASSAKHFAGSVAGIVAMGKACVSYNVTINKEVDLATPTARAFNSTWTTYGPYVASDDPFTAPIAKAGWTHAHRIPACGTAAEEEAPSHLITAGLEFPNGMRLRAGPYLNGLFPGPTPDDAVYFGVWQDVPGDLVVDVKAPTPECLVVIDTDFVPGWSIPGSGYVDRWWRQEPILP